jgi:hypothetical protein
MTFNKKEVWKHHLSESGHGRFDISCQSERDPMLKLCCYKHTLEIEKLAIEVRQQRLDAHYLEAAKIQRRVGYGWGIVRSEQRRLFEQEFKAQMPKKSLFTPAEPISDQPSPEDEYLERLMSCFCYTHGSHGCSGTEQRDICYRD